MTIDVEEGDSILSLLDLHALVPQVASEWVAGSEAAWLDYAMFALAKRGIVCVGTERGRAEAIVCLAALGHLYRRFWARVQGCGPVSVVVGDLIGPWPKLEPAWIGYLAGKDNLWDHLELGDGLDDELHAVLSELVEDAGRRCAAALIAELGEGDVFATLWASSGSDAVYPLDGERWHEIMNDSATGEKVDGYLWVDQGMCD